jgi:dTDP-4-amino-4,6-dideoxygalactose transaminase
MAAITGGEGELPFVDLSRAVEVIRDELDAAIATVLESGHFILGEQCSSFESEFATAISADHGVAVASGTDALELALRALGIGPGDEVVTQANTCVPTVAAIVRTGARPVLCDVEPEAATMDPKSLEDTLGTGTRAIIPVHLYGQCADMDAIGAVAASAGVPLIEDCAQATGAEFQGRKAGSIGIAGCFSFYPTKNLGALGDAGAVVTGDSGLADRLREVRQYGQSGRDRYERAGVNSRMDELQAAILRVKLPRLEAWNARRAEIAATYTRALMDAPVAPLLLLEHARHVFHLFVVTARHREEFRAAMRDRGIATMVHYPAPIHAHPAYRDLVRTPVTLEVAERLSEQVVSLPLHPELSDDEVERVATAARASSKNQPSPQ